MAAYENVREISVLVGVDNAGVPAVDRFLFADWKANGAEREVVLCAAGAVPAGVITMKVATKLNPGNAYLAPAVPMATPQGGIPMAMAGGNIAAGADIAVGANGKAVTAPSGAQVVGQATEAAVNGQIFAFQFAIGKLVP